MPEALFKFSFFLIRETFQRRGIRVQPCGGREGKGQVKPGCWFQACSCPP